jgi:hypothetical protein
MKNSLLFLALVIIPGFRTYAQQLSATSIMLKKTQMANVREPPQQADVILSNTPQPPQAKAAGAALYTQSFASMPAGWSVSTNSGSINGWRWAIAAPTGTGNNYPINGLINSTTKSNGWLLYNADSVISNHTGSTPFGGAVTSSPIAIGASHQNVMLSFQQYYRYSQGDSCFVDVSSNGTSWTAFPVYPNMALTQYGFLYRNPTITTINVSSVVGGQANAYIRFRFNSTAPTYSFNWLIDDLVLYDADSTDLGITYSGIVSASNRDSSFSSSYGYSSIPLQFADTVYPITYLSNYGLLPVANTVVTARYYLGNTLLATQTSNAAAPLAGRDSAVVIGNGYKPTAAGDYVVALSISQTGDGVAQNNADTIRFSVTDTVYASHGVDFTERNCYLNRPSASSIQYWGARFTISNGQHDTITSVSAAFRPVTAAGQRVQAQLYKASGSGTNYSWNPVAISTTRTLAASDISTASSVVIISFPFRISGHNYAPLILSDGDYAIVLTTVNATGDCAVYSMVPPLPAAPAFIGYQGQTDVSYNDGGLNFAVAGGIATGIVQVPLVHPNFGNARALLGIEEAMQILLGAAFPNPANESVHIPVALAYMGNAQITLTNAIGQEVARKDLGRMNAGVMQLASFATGQLPDGVYFYAVKAEGGQAAGRIVVRH